MQEGLILTMDVGKEMLGTLWQVEDGLQVERLFVASYRDEQPLYTQRTL